MIVYPLNGECGFSGRWGNITNITTVTSFDPLLLTIPPTATHYVRYTTGTTAQLVQGETITGGTSTATAVVVGVAVEGGTIGATTQHGIVFMQIPKVATPTAAGETWTGNKASGTIVTVQAPMFLKVYSAPVAALITCEVANAAFTMDGTSPTLTAGTSDGHTITSGQSYVVAGFNNIKNFKIINAANANGTVIKYSLFYE